MDRIFDRLDTQRQYKRGPDQAREAGVYVMASCDKGFDGLFLKHMSVADQLGNEAVRSESGAKIQP